MTDMTTTATPPLDAAAALERVIMTGDLRQLTPEDRTSFYLATCKSLGLNPLTRPFDYLTLNGKLTLYAKRDCCDQLRRVHNISITDLDMTEDDDAVSVRAAARTPEGRLDFDYGIVSIRGLKGDSLINARLKAVTKAKRRVTLSICGLGFLDETEVETIATEPQPPRAAKHTAEQRKVFKELVARLTAHGITQLALVEKMQEVTGVSASAELTEEQMQQVIDTYALWLGQCETPDQKENDDDDDLQPEP